MDGQASKKYYQGSTDKEGNLNCSVLANGKTIEIYYSGIKGSALINKKNRQYK